MEDPEEGEELEEGEEVTSTPVATVVKPTTTKEEETATTTATTTTTTDTATTTTDTTEATSTDKKAHGAKVTDVVEEKPTRPKVEDDENDGPASVLLVLPLLKLLRQNTK